MAAWGNVSPENGTYRPLLGCSRAAGPTWWGRVSRVPVRALRSAPARDTPSGQSSGRVTAHTEARVNRLWRAYEANMWYVLRGSGGGTLNPKP